MISILIPTRDSKGQFVKCVNSLVESCSHKDEVEYIVKVDNDTSEGNAINKFLKKRGCKYKLITSDRKRGYIDV